MKLENRLPGYCPDPSKVKLDPNSVLAKSLTRAKEFG